MRLDFYEPSTCLDPLTLMLMREAHEQGTDDEPECDVLASQYHAGVHRTTIKSSDNERVITGHHGFTT